MKVVTLTAKHCTSDYMQYNNTTEKNGLIQRYERYTEMGDGVVSGDGDFLKIATADVNESIFELTTLLMLQQDSFDWDDPYKTDYPIATTPLIADQRDYQFDSISFLKLKRVDVTYDGVNWVRAEAFDSTAYNMPLGNESEVDENFTTDAPKYDPKGFGFWLYPRATAAQVAAGAKARIEYSRGHTEYVSTDTTKQPPIDRPFHDLIAIGAALRHPSISNDQYTKLTNKYEEGKAVMLQHYAGRNEDTFLTWPTDLREQYK